jgi:hypothetical protein
MAPTDYEAFRAGIDDLLRTLQRYADNHEGPRQPGDPVPTMPQLSPCDCQRIPFAIKNRHDPVKVWKQPRGTEEAEQLGRRFVGQLAEADRNLKPYQVGDLVMRVLARIPEEP